MNRRQRGFTLIELMVALVVSSLLVGMILAIFSRMSAAYRGQQQIAGVQQVLAAARATIELDAKQAGLQMPQGFKFANDPGDPPPPHSPVTVVDSSTGPDQVSFFYADPTVQAKVAAAVTSWLPTPRVTVDSVTGFSVGDLVALSTINGSISSSTIADATTGADIATYDVCALRIATIGVPTADAIGFENVAPWGRATTNHCTLATTQTMLYKLIARAYRIDTSTPVRAALGPLQQSQFGGLTGTVADDWKDLAYGFTDIQTALRVYDKDDIADSDGDGDATRDWYSDSVQANKTAAAAVPPSTVTPIQISISLVARTDRDVEGIATSATPELVKPSNISNNSLGNRASVALPSTTDDALKGPKIYRYTTFQVDLRNMGVGR